MDYFFVFLVVSCVATFVITRLIAAGAIGFAAADAPDALPPAAAPGPRSVPLTSERVRYRCGHRYAAAYAHEFHGQRVDIDESYLGQRERCGECLLRENAPHVIRCALCGGVIVPGEAVTAYRLERPPAHATVAAGGFSVCCTRIGCGEAGYSGYWTRGGYKPITEASR